MLMFDQENAYTYAMWIAFYHEWKAAGGKPSGYEGQLGQPARISDKLCAHIISTALAEYQTTDRACSWTIAGRLAVKVRIETLCVLRQLVTGRSMVSFLEPPGRPESYRFSNSFLNPSYTRTPTQRSRWSVPRHQPHSGRTQRSSI